MSIWFSFGQSMLPIENGFAVIHKKKCRTKTKRAIKKGLLEGPADFYENKHLNSDLLCCNFTELSDDEFYDALKWANSELTENYYEKELQKELRQVDRLYDDRDASFRGFRHGNARDVKAGSEHLEKGKIAVKVA